MESLKTRNARYEERARNNVCWLVVCSTPFFSEFLGGFKHCWLAFLCAILAVAQPPPIIRYHLVILGPSNTKQQEVM